MEVIKPKTATNRLIIYHNYSKRLIKQGQQIHCNQTQKRLKIKERLRLKLQQKPNAS